MTGRRWTLRVGLAVGSLAMVGCSNSSSSSTTSTTIAAGTTSTTTAASATATNLPVTDPIRTQLVAAASALQGIPVAEFSGLAPGLTYYGLDKTTGSHWAGARLVAAPVPQGATPSQAQVSTQDEGSYYVFRQPAGGAWIAYAAGNTGPGTVCPVTVPPGILQVWGWPAGSCRPRGV